MTRVSATSSMAAVSAAVGLAGADPRRHIPRDPGQDGQTDAHGQPAGGQHHRQPVAGHFRRVGERHGGVVGQHLQAVPTEPEDERGQGQPLKDVHDPPPHRRPGDGDVGAEDRPVERDDDVVGPRRGDRADGVTPRALEADRRLLREVAHRRLGLGALDVGLTRHLGQAGQTRDRAVRIDAQLLERVAATHQPAGDRPSGEPCCASSGGRLDRLDELRHPDALEQRVVEGVAVDRADSGALTGAAQLGEPVGRRGDVGGEPALGRLLGPDALGQLALEIVDAVAAGGGGPDDGDPLEPLVVEDAPDVAEGTCALLVRDAVDLVEHDQGDVLERGHRADVAVVDGGVGVLLRVEHPHQDVGVVDQAVHLEVVLDLGGVVVGQVEQHEAVELLVLGRVVEHAEPRHLVTCRDAHPLQQLLGAFGTPCAGQRPRGGGPSDADARELEVGE